MNAILILLLALSIPILSEYLAKKHRLFSILGPVVLCYIIGMLCINFGLIHSDETMRELLSSISVPLAIGLLLLTGNLKSWFQSAPKAVISFTCIALSTVLMSLLGYVIFKDKIAHIEYFAGFFSAVYIGGSANMAAVNIATEAPKGLYDIAMIADVVLGGFFLIYTMGIAPHLYKKILRPSVLQDTSIQITEGPFQWLDLAKGILLVSIATGISAGISWIFYGKIESGFLILLLTTICAIFSLSPNVRKLESSKRGGDYFLLVFASIMGLSSDLSLFNPDAFQVLYYMSFVMLGSMLLHLTLSYFLKIDRDTHLITSTAGIMSPPFIPGVASALNNRAILMTGLTAGIVGNLIGTYIGIFITHVLK